MKVGVSLAAVTVLVVAVLRAEVPVGDTRGATWDDDDWAILEEKARWALATGLDTVPLGESMAALGRSFVGTPYVPHTLEAEGPEALVINFRGLDCVTFVENAFALARFVREPGALAILEDRASAEGLYETLLAEVRYRDGRLEGYPSRLHYFSDWILDNARRGLVRDESQALGGVPDDERVDFMSTHPEAYRQLSDAGNLDAIRMAEAALAAHPRHVIPEDRIGAVAGSIRNGDIIAAASSVPGLDIAHTGLALWVGGELRLLHAPLSGSEVQISPVSLAERITRMGGQDGIMVARPVDR